MNTITRRKGNFKYELWETNKGPALGYCSWAIYRWYPELERWSKLTADSYPQTIDMALREAEHALQKYSRTDLDNQNLYTDAAQHNNVLKSRFRASQQDNNHLDEN